MRKNHLPFQLKGVPWIVLAALTSVAFGQLSENDVIKRIEQAQWAKETNLLGYSVTETYTVVRNGETTPAASLVVRTVYKKDKGKNYTDVKSRTGSGAVQRLVLNKILKREEEISQDDTRKHILITTDNYNMKLSGEETVGGRKCLVLDLKAKTKSPYLLDGQAWIDSETYELVRIQGRPNEKPSFWTGRPLIDRNYKDTKGFPLATKARAESHSLLFGTTVVVIEYSEYDVTVAPQTRELHSDAYHIPVRR
jgi:hypothetical protein